MTAGPTTCSSSTPTLRSFLVTCIYAYVPKETPDIVFKAGDLLKVVKVAPSGWICAEVDTNKYAWLPITYTRRRKELKALVKPERRTDSLQSYQLKPTRPCLTYAVPNDHCFNLLSDDLCCRRGLLSSDSSSSSLASLNTDESCSDNEDFYESGSLRCVTACNTLTNPRVIFMFR